jgi:hypothetical protein
MPTVEVADKEFTLTDYTIAAACRPPALEISIRGALDRMYSRGETMPLAKCSIRVR